MIRKHVHMVKQVKTPCPAELPLYCACFQANFDEIKCWYNCIECIFIKDTHEHADTLPNKFAPKRNFAHFWGFFVAVLLSKIVFGNSISILIPVDMIVALEENEHW